MKRETRLRPARGGKLFEPVAGLTPTIPKYDDVTLVRAPRCFLCHRGVDNNRRYAVCAQCDDAHEIRRAWATDFGDIDATKGHNAERECSCPGWLWMNEEGDASFNVERCDSCALFRDDHEAAAAMMARCQIRWSRCGE